MSRDLVTSRYLGHETHDDRIQIIIKMKTTIYLLRNYTH